MNNFRYAPTGIRLHALLLALALLTMFAAPAARAQASSGGERAIAEAIAPVEAWFYLGRRNDAGAWAPASGALRLDSAKEPKRVTVLRDAVLVDNINPDTPGAQGDSALAAWTRVVRRGPAAIAVMELVRQDSIGNGKLVWAKVRVPGERVEVTQRR